MKPFLLTAFISSFALVLSACQTDNRSVPNAGPCPIVSVLYDASRIVELHGGEVFGNVGFTGEVMDAEGYCRYFEDRPIDMQLDINFAFGKGPMAEGNTKDFTYFVAVTRRGTSVLEKERFTIRADFREGETVTTAFDSIKKIVIPRANETVSGANFEVVIGFELTAEQIEFNRSGKRFRAGTGG